MRPVEGSTDIWGEMQHAAIVAFGKVVGWSAPAFVDILICPGFSGAAFLESSGV